jgi:hypothetical protein
MRRATPILAASAALILSSVVAGPAAAQDSTAAPASTDRLHWVITPYFMFPAMYGTLGIGALNADVNLQPGDILSHLQLGLMLNVEARKGPWALGVDAIYMDLEQQASNASLTVGAREAALEVAAFRRVSQVAEVIVGARGMAVEGSLTGQVQQQPVNASLKEDWVDPIIGIRACSRSWASSCSAASSSGPGPSDDRNHLTPGAPPRGWGAILLGCSVRSPSPSRSSPSPPTSPPRSRPTGSSGLS